MPRIMEAQENIFRQSKKEASGREVVLPTLGEAGGKRGALSDVTRTEKKNEERGGTEENQWRVTGLQRGGKLQFAMLPGKGTSKGITINGISSVWFVVEAIEKKATELFY